jgi:uncharacterized repeat protein (TIGR01451 family)
MKKILLFTFIFLFIQLYVHGQICNQGLSPNQGTRGQTLTTTITNTQLFNGYGSAPCNPSDVYLEHSSTATTIYATSVSIQNDIVHVSWNLPSNAPIGGYDLHLDQYTYHPVNGNCIVGPQTCIRPLAFGIGTVLISGSVFYDSNQDSIFNSVDRNLSGIRVLLMPDSIITFTDNTGMYTFFADTGAGNRTIILLNDSLFYSVNSDSVFVQIDSVNIDSIDFAVYPAPNSYNTAINVSGLPRCNTNQTYSFGYRNSSLFPINLVIQIYHSPNAPFVSSVPPPDSISGDTLFYTLLNVPNGSGKIDIIFQIPGIGDTIHIYSVANSFDLSNNLVDNDANKLDHVVRCSFDPNDKAVYPEGEQAQHYTLFDELLFYKIRFQNTGNDTAYDVHIIDTLDSNLDLNSLQIFDYSHPLVVEATFDGIINFKFNNIMLPDSFVDEPASNGFVSYTIKALKPIPEMTVISNKAYIYFDLNAPVLTNETENTMVSMIPVGIKNPDFISDVVIYPNPFNESLIISGKSISQSDYRLSIVDLQGRELMKIKITSDNYRVDMRNFSPGVYIYKLTDEKNNQLQVGKLVKQ